MVLFNVTFWGKLDLFKSIKKILIINAVHLIKTLEYILGPKSRLIFINLIENLRGIRKTVILGNNQEKNIYSKASFYAIIVS